MDSKLIARVIRTLLICATCSLPAIAAPPDPCSLLTQSQVSTVLGTNVAQPKLVAPRMCEWSAANRPTSMNAKKSVVLLLSNERAFSFAKTPVVSDAKAIAAAGIGDDAVYSVASGVSGSAGTGLYVKKGDSYFVVHLYGFSEQAKAMEMEKALALEVCSKL